MLFCPRTRIPHVTRLTLVIKKYNHRSVDAKKKRGSKWKKGCQHKNKYEVAIKKLIEPNLIIFLSR